MNPFDTISSDDEAIIEYDDGDFHVVKPGAFVICAVSGTRIPLKALRYWSVDKQEPYLDAATALQAMKEAGSS
ncbi:DUF2093 domain-containing protein [Hyphococcus flavus]